MTGPDHDQTLPLDRDDTPGTSRNEGPPDPARTLPVEPGTLSESSQARRIGNYRVLDQLGQGGQGAVLLAEDERLGRRVALKVLSSALSFSSDARLRFEREAEVASKLDHPGIARIYELGQSEDLLYIAMEYVPGQSLAERLSEARDRGTESQLTGTPRPSEILDAEEPATEAPGQQPVSGTRKPSWLRTSARFIEDAARTLHAAHEAGLIHRDIKPGNMMVRADGSPCILDFGLARDDDSESVALTQTGDVMGTPAYMSPEQIVPHKLRIDRRTDVYSLGVSLFECCTLKRPFEEPTRQELQQAILHKEPPRPRSVNPRVPRDLEAIILTAIDRNPDRRYATALALAEDLERYRNHEPVLARPSGKLVRTARWLRRNPTLAALFLTIVISLATGLAVVAANNRSLARRGTELEGANRELTVRMENERRARMEADGVATLIETVLLSITSFKGDAAADVTVRQLLDEIAVRLSGDEELEDVVRARVAFTLGNAYRGLELIGAAEKHWLTALEALRRAYPEGNDTVARVLHRLADLRTNRSYAGRVSMADARSYAAEARALYERLHGIGSAEAQTALGTLAALELVSAKGAVTEPPAMFIGLLTGFHPKLSRKAVRDGLSRELVEVSRLWVAGDREAAAARVRYWVEPTMKGHPFIVNQSFVAMARVAEWALKNGYPDFGAGVLHERVLAARRVKGGQDPFVGRCISDEARYLERRGRPEQAFAKHGEAVAFLRGVCKPSSIVLLDAIDYMARAAVHSGHGAEARKLVAERLAVTLDAVEPDDPIFADAFLMDSLVEGQLAGDAARLAALERGMDCLRKRGARQNLALVTCWRVQALLRDGRRDAARRDLAAARATLGPGETPRKDVAASLAECETALARPVPERR